MLKIEGILEAVSHVFYLPGESKCFILQLRKKDNGRMTVIARLHLCHPSLKQVQNDAHNLIGTFVKITDTKQKSLRVSPDLPPLDVYQVVKESTFEVMSDESMDDQDFETSNNTNDSMVSYQGIVCNDKFKTAGIFSLDLKVTVVATGLCVITNLRQVSKGQKVMVREAHLEKEQNGRLSLYLCGRSRVDIVDDFRDNEDQDRYQQISMHCKASVNNFSANGFVQYCLNENLTPRQILCLFRNVTQLSEIDSLASLSSLIGDQTTLEEWRNFTDFFDLKVEKQSSRRLLTEYLYEPHDCKQEEVAAKGSSIVQMNTNLSWIRNDAVTLTPFDVVKTYEWYVQDYESSSFVIGFLSICSRTGHYQIEDLESTTTIPLAFLHNQQPDASVKKKTLIRLIKFRACQERAKTPQAMEFFYLLVIDFKLFELDKNKIPADLDGKAKGGPSWTAIFHSSPTLRGQEMDRSLCVLAAATTKSEDNSCTKFLRLPLESCSRLSFPLSTELTLHSYSSEKYSFRLNQLIKDGCFLNAKPKIIDITEFTITKLGRGSGYDFKDVYVIPDEFDDISNKELVSIEAVIAEKWIELPRFALSPDQICLDTFLGNVDVQLKLATSIKGKTISLYVKKWTDRAFPLGLLPGFKIRADNIVKLTSKKSFSYLMTTLFTTFSVLEPPNLGSSQFSRETDASFISPPCKRLLQDHPGDLLLTVYNSCTDREKAGTIAATEINLKLTLECVKKVSLNAHCGACGHKLCRGRCSFVGCHADMDSVPIKLSTNALFLVEDATASATLVVDSIPVVKKVLKIGDREWSEYVEVAKKSGELLYLNSKTSAKDATTAFEAAFIVYCEWFPRNVCRMFSCLCRPFKQSLTDCASTIIDDRDARQDMRLYCLDILSHM